tara:strand:+ start:229 stop:1992 length:1764 start_codon:yes stop_codon:yes gene_type:complete
MTDIHQFNKGAKSWRIYAKELTSKSGDHLDISSSGDIIFTAGEIRSKGDLVVEGEILPKDDSEDLDIGSADKPFRDLYISENSIHMGSNVILTVDPSNDHTFKIKKFRNNWNTISSDNITNRLSGIDRTGTNNNASRRAFLRNLVSHNISIRDIEDDIFEDDNLEVAQLVFKQPSTNYKLTLAPDADMSKNITFKLPIITGTNGQVLQTDGDGKLTWTNQSGGSSDAVTLSGTQTLTNKTLTSPIITSPTITGTGAIAGTFTGDITSSGTSTFGSFVIEGNTIVHNTNYASLSNAYAFKLSSGGRVRINSYGDSDIQFRNNDDNTNLMSLISNGNVEIPGTLIAGGNTFPTNSGSSGQVLTTDGAGTLSWQTSSGGEELESDNVFGNLIIKSNREEDPISEFRDPNHPSIFVFRNMLYFGSNDGHHLSAGDPNFFTTDIFIGDGFFEGNVEYESFSDDRLKFNEKDISNSLHLIRQITPKKYDKSSLLNQELNTIEEAGLIAQDILLINDLSWCVGGGDYYDQSNNLIEKSYRLAYNSLSMYHLAATKELDILVQQQVSEIESLKSENAIMKTALNELLSEAGKQTI